MPFHIDHRPKDFNEIIGNKTLIESLNSVIIKNNRPHSYFFYGPSGCGKTTLARILTKKFNCKESGIIEINSSNNNGVDTARDIINQCIYSPLEGEVKCYILDEVHNTSKQFQDAMLKVTEDTPSHVYFILCTTEPNKIQKALKSRCASFEIKKPTISELGKYLLQICEKNHINLDKNIILEIIKHTDSTPRDSLILLEKISGITDLSKEEIMNCINNDSIIDKEVIEICRLLTNERTSWSELSVLLKNINTEPETMRRAVIGYAQSILLNKSNMRAYNIIEAMKNNFFDSGKPGFIAACFKILNTR